MTMLQRWLPLAACCIAAVCALYAVRAQDGGNRDEPPPRNPPPRNAPPRNDGRPLNGPSLNGPPRDGQVPGLGGNVPGFGENGPRQFGPRPDGPRPDGHRPDGPRGDGPPMPFGRDGGPPNAGPHGNGPHAGPRGPVPFNIDDLRERDPEMFELMQADVDLDRRTHELADAVRRAAGDEQKSLRAELEKIASQHFDVRQQRRTLQLKRMEKELARLREGIEKRNELRSAIIQQHIGELLGENEKLDF